MTVTAEQVIATAQVQFGAALDDIDRGGCSWTISREAWRVLLLNSELAKPFVQWTSDPAHPTFMGLPVHIGVDVSRGTPQAVVLNRRGQV